MLSNPTGLSPGQQRCPERLRSGPMGPGPAAVERSIQAFRAAARWDIAP